MSKTRGFEVVDNKHRTNFDVFKDDKGKSHKFPKSVKLPTRADKGSSGYDFYLPKDIMVLPYDKKLIWTDVKAYMQEDEELLLFIRSSLAVKHGITLANAVGKIDSSYYNNESNGGNIGIVLVNNTGRAVELKEGDRIAQGTFYKYLLADEDNTLHEERIGGIGSSDR